MTRYLLTKEAQEDLSGIREYLLREAGVRVTRRLLVAIVSAFHSLARNPGQGHRREDLVSREEVRFWPVFSYLVVYRIDRKPLTILAVIHGSRDVQRWLKER